MPETAARHLIRAGLRAFLPLFDEAAAYALSMTNIRIALGLPLLAGSLSLAQAPNQPPEKQTTPSDAAPAATEPAESPSTKRIDVTPAQARWLDRVSRDERAAFDDLLGWAPPTFTADLKWLDGSPLSWNELRGKVVVIQSFTTGNMAGRNWPMRVANALEKHGPADLRIIALHTPDKAEEAEAFLARKPAPEGVRVAIDPIGTYCDALAIYREPTCIIVDRSGVVRYAALNLKGLEEAVDALVAEPFNQTIVASPRDGSESGASMANAEFPTFTGKIDSAIDIRGKRAPDFQVAQWLNTEAPNARDKVVVIDFWATWCPPCVASIPHMNELSDRFRGDVVCVGISDEPRDKFDAGLAELKSQKITMETFKYALALDPDATMKNAIKVRGIPHCLVMDRNWIVRWQGHPAALDAGTLEKIVRADKAVASSGGESKPAARPGSKRKTWTER